MALEIYRRKRKFGVTGEPRGRLARAGGNRFVIQKHAARRLHYDLRLELDGVMKSWAVTRGPSLDPGEKRLAVQVEDHPVEYNSFEGTIPHGEYGGGTVMIWDRGGWTPEGDPHRGLATGHLDFTLDGEKLRGRWHLVRMRRLKNDRHNNWLLIKGRDGEAVTDRDILKEEPLSVASGRSMEEIAAGKGKKRVWHSNRAGGDPQGKNVPADTALGRVWSTAKRKPSPKASVDPGAQRQLRSTRSAATKIARQRSPAPKRPAATAPLPDFVPPSLATLASEAPGGPRWLHEIKFDGYRIEARLDHRQVRLLTRNRQDWTDRFATIARAIARLPAKTALIDGELVVQDDNGVSDFSLLQSDLKAGCADRLVYWAFDLLHLDGRDLTLEPLVARKAALERLLRQQAATGPIRYVEAADEEGWAILKHACELGLEGIVSKLRDAPYRSGRSQNFIKTKCYDRQEVVVVGFIPSTALPRAVGALTVAFHEAGVLRYAGRIGTGYSHEVARDLWRRLAALKVDEPPVELPPTERRKGVVWVKPELVVEAEFRGFTGDRLLRQAAYKGLREDKPAGEVVRETAIAAARRGAVRKSARPVTLSDTSKPRRSAARARAVDVANVRLSHPDRVYWVDVGVTKEGLAEYYARVWDHMAPHVVGRPLAVVRCPSGTIGECFFQKHIAASIKESPLRHAVDAKERDVIAVQNLADMIELVQSGALEIHVRGSRLERLEICDRLVFDLDPGEGVGWRAIVDAANEIRERLEAETLVSFVKLSGGKGIHVVLPLDGADWDAAKTFSARVAAVMAADAPDRYVAKMTKALRPGKIFIDYFRNTREATSVAAYSTRARPGAPVSMPLSWEELAGTGSANQFTVLNAAEHIARGWIDPWADLGKVRQRLPG